MKKIKHFIKSLYVKMSVFKYCLQEYRYLVNNLGSIRTSNDKDKMKYSLLLQCHIIEKGLSLNNVRFGFGIPKITHLLLDLREYYHQYQDQEMLYFVLSIIKQYIDFHRSNDKDIDIEINNLYNDLALHLDNESKEKYQLYCGGIETKAGKEVKGITFPYEEFVKSRHSIRTFTGEPVSKEIIYKALKIAETTPSACNRQPWKIYVNMNKEKVIRILDIQTGARQFKEQVAAVIIIGSTANAFSITERHQPYLNGGLYAMNLMLAFHSLGIGTIPLNLGIEDKKLEKLKNEVGMSSDSLPVLMLAIGQIPEIVKVACSKRFSFIEYTNFD